MATKTMTGLRIDDDLLARIDALVGGRPSGLSVPRSEIIRLAIRTGLDVLEPRFADDARVRCEDAIRAARNMAEVTR
jgi:metal-responsive CopG/Arc/MetJ family transcriptional regulator